MRWQSVLRQTFPFIREWYLGLSGEGRRRFDRRYASAFFTHAATQPRLNAAKLLALLRAGLVRIVRLGRSYRFRRDEPRGGYRFDYVDTRGCPRSDRYRYVVNARGQDIHLDTNTTELARNLIASGWIDREPAPPTASAVPERAMPYDGTGQNPSATGRPLGIRIDPHTHRVLSSPDDRGGRLYAVGAMTRHLIIDTSMAHGISQSTRTIADQLIGWLLQNRS